MKANFVFLTLLLISSFTSTSQEVYQWRGPERDGIYKEKNLLKSWPLNGPELLWINENIGEGYGSMAV